MASEEDLGNRVQLLYEAIVDEASIKAAEDRMASSAKRTTAQTETEFRNRVAAEERARKEGERIQRQQTIDQDRELRDRVKREERQRKESKDIRDAMLRDEQNALREVERARDEGHKNEAKRAADRKKWARERIEADRISAGGLPPGEQAPKRTGRQLDPFLTSLGFGLSSSGVPGSRILGGLAIGTGFGGESGFKGAAVGAGILTGVGLVTAAIGAIKLAMDDITAEQKFAAAIRSVGVSYQEAKTNAEAFHASMIVSRQESQTLSAALAQASVRIKTSSEDIKAISTIGTAKGQTPEELAKVINQISQGNKQVFEEETGLKAQIVIDEYARTLGKLPSELDDAARAQALWNSYKAQGINYDDLAAQRMSSAEGRWLRFKNQIADLSVHAGKALLDTYATEGDPLWLNAIKVVSPVTAITSVFLNRKKVEAQYQKEEDAAAKAESEKQKALLTEQQRQRDLENRYVGAERFGQGRLKELSAAKAGDTPEERFRNLQKFRAEFQGLTGDLDQADPRIIAISNDIEQKLSQAVGSASGQIEGLAKTISASLGEFAGLTSAGEKNPFIKLYTDSEDRARVASERFRLFGDEVVSQYNRMAKAADEAAQYDLRVGTAMRAVSLEFEAANLAKPFNELTGEMKRSLSVLQAEVGAATHTPALIAQATAIDLYSRYRTPQANERAFGQFGVSETSGLFVQSQEFARLQKLGRTYTGEGRGGEEGRHILDLELIRLFGQMDPGVRARALRQPGGEYAQAFGGAFRREAAYSESGVERAIERADVGRNAVREAQLKLNELSRLQAQPGSNRDRTRAEYLAITGALPREELTPSLLKGRMDALKEEAVFQKAAEARAQKAVEDAKTFQTQLVGENGKGGILKNMLDELHNRNEQVILRVLDESSRARIDTLGGAYKQ